MTRKNKVLLGIGAGATAAVIVAGVRHCIRSMAPSGTLGRGIDLRQRGSAQGWCSSDGAEVMNDQAKEAGAVAA